MKGDESLYADAMMAVRRGRYDDAAKLLRQFLRNNAHHVGALNVLAVCYVQLSNYPEAEIHFREAIGVDGTSASTFYNYGIVLRRLDRLNEACDAFTHTIRLNPASVDSWNDRGSVLSSLHRHGEALADFERAILLKPDMKNAWAGKGYALERLNRNDEALQSYSRALQIDPGLVEALIGRAHTLYKVGEYQAAARDFAAASAIDGARDYLKGDLLNARAQICDWDALDSTVAALTDDIRNGKLASGPFPLLSVATSAATQLECARLYSAKTFVTSAPVRRTGNSDRNTKRDRIRVAYLSSDFHQHATSYLIAGLFEKHDRAKFEIFGISFGIDDHSDTRRRMERSFDRFIDVRDRTDEEISALIREHGIDIAVDLKGYTTGNRTEILAGRAAPIQISYLGYPGTMGADFIDYIIADRIVIPEDQIAHYSEQVIHLPDCYQVNDDARIVVARETTRADAGLPENGFVFCCFNNNFKITPVIFDVWMRLLQKVDGSVLWLLAGNSDAAANLRHEAEKRGVEPDRLIFAKRTDLDSHMSRQRLADLFLDTVYYNAHTTTSDALWVGLPVITCIGSTFAGRVAASLLSAIGMPDLIVSTLAEYEDLAVALARDPPRLASIRARLAANRATYPLFDTVGFARKIEAAYVKVYEDRIGSAAATNR